MGFPIPTQMLLQPFYLTFSGSIFGQYSYFCALNEKLKLLAESIFELIQLWNNVIYIKPKFICVSSDEFACESVIF